MTENKNIPLIETRGLKTHFKVARGTVHAVDGVDLTIETGKTLGVVGESGCGKSTLGRTILRILEPTAGEVLFNGENVTNFKGQDLLNFKRNAQIIFQDPYSSIDPRLTVAQTIAQPMIVNKTCASKAEREKRVTELMDTVGLSERVYNAYPHELDGGRLQRVGVARALALNPKFIVCDEPVSALDVSIQAQILNLLMDLQDDLGLTYMFITHDLSVVKHISDEIMVMYLGVCVERASTRELFKNPLHPYTQALLSAIPVPNLSARSKKPKLIRGEVTNPIDPPDACRFANRCPFATEECHHGTPKLKQVGEEHWVACNRF